MSRLPAFLFGMVCGAALLWVAMNYHVVRARDGFHFVAKQPARLSDAFIDIREFNLTDWAGHPQLAAALVQADKQHLVGDSAAASIQENIQQLLPAWPKQ